jgi:hypothetical protein
LLCSIVAGRLRLLGDALLMREIVHAKNVCHFAFKGFSRCGTHQILRCDTIPSSKPTHSFMCIICRGFFGLCAREKKWWLLPLAVLPLILAAVLISASSSGFVWFLYPHS